MKRIFVAMFVAALGSSAANASDACSTRAIRTVAEVQVSDGTKFQMESFFRAKDTAAVRQTREAAQTTVAAEGPFGWLANRAGARLAGDMERGFALGHQFHAFVLHFDEVVATPTKAEAISFAGGERSGLSGALPYGGKAHLVAGEVAARPAGMVYVPPDTAPIEIAFDDWRPVGQVVLPFRLRIDDGSSTFVYNYTTVEITAQSPLWFFEAVSAPDLDPVRVYRLHRTLMAAHCLADADLMARLTAPKLIVADGGQILQSSAAELRTQLAATFAALKYTNYTDLTPPTIEVSSGGDVGWLAASVRPQGIALRSGKAFDDEWAWIMTVRKVDGAWKTSGIASSRRPQATP